MASLREYAMTLCPLIENSLSCLPEGRKTAVAVSANFIFADGFLLMKNISFNEENACEYGGIIIASMVFAVKVRNRHCLSLRPTRELSLRRRIRRPK